MKSKSMIVIRDDTEMTLRADVSGDDLQHIKLPDPVELSTAEAQQVALWARHFSATCLTDVDILVSDIRPSAAYMTLSDLDKNLASRLRENVAVAMRHGFGMRLMRNGPTEPYTLSVVRRIIDVPQLTIPYRSFRNFLEIISSVQSDAHGGWFCIDSFAETLHRKYHDCMDAGYAHYQAYCLRIVEYGQAHGAKRVVWGPEKRGAVPAGEVSIVAANDETSAAEAAFSTRSASEELAVAS